jgi:hypothetical protein
LVATSIGGLMPSSLYFFFGGKDWKVYYIVPLITPILAFICSLFLPESPIYLYEKCKFHELRENIKTMARVNKVEMDEKYKIDAELNTFKMGFARSRLDYYASQKHTINIGMIRKDTMALHGKYSTWKSLRDKRTLLNLLIVVTLFSIMSFNYYMISLYIKYIGGNIFCELYPCLYLRSNCMFNSRGDV